MSLKNKSLFFSLSLLYSSQLFSIEPPFLEGSEEMNRSTISIPSEKNLDAPLFKKIDQCLSESNIQEAIHLFEQGIQEGILESLYVIGQACLDGQFSWKRKVYRTPFLTKDFNKGLDLLTKAAENGYPEAQNELGYLYLGESHGKKIRKDIPKALELFQKAVEQQVPEAYVNLGVLYQEGLGVHRDYQKATLLFNQAIDLFQEKANQGDAESCLNLGVLYFEGSGIPQDLPRAFELFQEAATQNHPGAQFFLGVMYENGQGVPKDIQKAFEFYKKAADQELPYAQQNLASFYFLGQGVSQDKQKAMELMKKAADQDLGSALFSLGLLKLTEEKIPQEEKEAVALLRKAARQGIPEARNMLGNLYAAGIKGVSQDYREALKHYQKAIKKGSQEAWNSLKQLTNDLYEKGEKILQRELSFYLSEQDRKEAAIEFFLLAAKYGHSNSLFKLGTLYEQGIGVTKDHQKAKDYFKKTIQ